jgi:hypothetical protein
MLNSVAGLALWFMTAVAPPVKAPGPVRVFVNRGSGLESVSLVDLARMYRGEISSLPSGVRIVLAEQVQARARFYASVVQMSEDSFRRHWIRVVFAGSPAIAPRTFTSTEEIVAFVARTPGAIGFSDGAVDESVRVIRIDDQSAGRPDYPIR